MLQVLPWGTGLFYRRQFQSVILLRNDSCNPYREVAAGEAYRVHSSRADHNRGSATAKSWVAHTASKPFCRMSGKVPSILNIFFWGGVFFFGDVTGVFLWCDEHARPGQEGQRAHPTSVDKRGKDGVGICHVSCLLVVKVVDSWMSVTGNC